MIVDLFKKYGVTIATITTALGLFITFTSIGIREAFNPPKPVEPIIPFIPLIPSIPTKTDNEIILLGSTLAFILYIISKH